MVIRRVWVVEEVTQHREQLLGTLSAAGHEVRSTSSMEEVLVWIKAGVALPHAVLLSTTQGPINGFEACSALMQSPETAGIAVLMCADRASAADHDWAHRQGAMDYLIKPVEAAALLAKVERAVQKKNLP